MDKYFYSHLVDIQSIIVELDKLDLSDKERIHLAQLVDSSLHHTILDAIMSELSEEDKRVFINHLKEGDNKKTMDHLSDKIDHIEDKIKAAADDLKKDLHKDIKEAKEKK